MDRIGIAPAVHRFAVMRCFSSAAFENLTRWSPVLAIFGLSYFFVEFGQHDHFVLLQSVPVSMRTTPRIAAGVGKLGRSSASSLVPSCRSTTGCGHAHHRRHRRVLGLPSRRAPRAVGRTSKTWRPAGWDRRRRREPTHVATPGHLAEREPAANAPRSRRPRTVDSRGRARCAIASRSSTPAGPIRAEAPWRPVTPVAV